MQATLRSPARFEGIGLHSGKSVSLTVLPASAEYGVWFKRTDVAESRAFVPAKWDHVQESRLCTRIANARGVSVSTIEHIMAALAGCGIQNALIEVDGEEVPILDGSSAPFVRAFLERGIQKLDAPLRAIEVLRSVEVREGDAVARIEPAGNLHIDFAIDFDDAAIGAQQKSLSLANGAFVHELCDSRTFCRQSDVVEMQNAGLALGGSYENAVVVDGADILSPGGLRHRDEAVRHKMLDALGDLALAGAPVIGSYRGVRAGHALTNKLLRKLMSDPRAFRMIDCDPSASRKMPGEGVSLADIPAAPEFA